MNAEIPIEAAPVRRLSLSRHLGPLGRRRWAVFKANRRGYWSLWIFLALYALSLGAELIANDKPILMGFRGEPYAPVLFEYPETAFGGTFETEADYTDPAVDELIADLNWSLPERYSANPGTALA